MRIHYLLYKDEVVAKQGVDGDMHYVQGIVPPSLFGFEDNRHPCKFSDFKRWMFNRIIPRNRYDLKYTLEKAGIDFYDEWLIISKTKCRQIGRDFYSVDWEDVDED